MRMINGQQTSSPAAFGNSWAESSMNDQVVFTFNLYYYIMNSINYDV